jgi:uncharacterized membrane-anchored protein
MKLLDIVLNNTLVIAVLVEVCASVLAFFGKINADDWMKITLVILGYTGGLYVGRFSVEQSKAKSS